MNIKVIISLLVLGLSSAAYAESCLPSEVCIKEPDISGVDDKWKESKSVGVMMIKAYNVNTFQSQNILYYVGPITQYSREILEYYSEQYPEVDTIALASGGGVAYESFDLGSWLSDKKMKVIVPRGQLCLSACAYAFMGGTDYEINGLLGFHNASIGGFPENTEWDLNKINSVYVAGQVLGTQASYWFMVNGFHPLLATHIMQKTDREKFIVFGSGEQFNKWYVRNDEEPDLAVNYLALQEDLTELVIMDGPAMSRYLQTSPSLGTSKLLAMKVVFPTVGITKQGTP